MSTSLRPHRARTSLHHIYPAHVLASAKAHQQLEEDLKAEALCIAINRKAQPLPRLTRQDLSALAEYSERVDRDTKLAVTLAVVETLDTKELLEERKRSWHFRDSQLVDDYPAKRIKKLEDATQGPARH
jgi:predicted ATP-grasp superfamily ATP-dependent carboligase